MSDHNSPLQTQSELFLLGALLRYFIPGCARKAGVPQCGCVIAPSPCTHTHTHIHAHTGLVFRKFAFCIRASWRRVSTVAYTRQSFVMLRSVYMCFWVTGRAWAVTVGLGECIAEQGSLRCRGRSLYFKTKPFSIRGIFKN